MKKIQMLLLVAVVALVGMPVVSALSITTYSPVKDYTLNGSHTDKYGTEVQGVSDDQNKTTIFDIENRELEVIDKTKATGIPDNYDDSTLFGVAVEDPQPAEGLEKACWVRPGDSDCKQEGDAVKDSTDKNSRTLWISFKAEELKKALEDGGKDAVVEKTILLQWGGKDDKENVQKIIVRLHAGSVTLKNDPDAGDSIATGSEFTEEDRAEAIAVYEKNHPETSVEPTKEPAEQAAEKNADTADINLGLLLSVLAISTLGLGYTFKKRFN